MSTVRHLLNPKPPPILYHYTTPGGLLGILGHREMWASHTQYLNDQLEFKHAVSIIENEIASMKKEAEYKEHLAMLDDMLSVLGDSETMNVCVCSFSERGDVLSQWRAYGGGAGFSIGFRGEFLRTIVRRDDWFLAKCIYDEAAQKTAMRMLLDEVIRENAQKKGSADDIKITGGNLGAYLNRYAPLLKHKSFEEEQEWRIITRPLMSSREGFEFRAGTSMLIPYYKIPLFTDTETFHVEEVVVGPTPNSRQSRRSLQSLLVKHNLKETRVKNTDAPFRNW